jgi:hypothetical protein
MQFQFKRLKGSLDIIAGILRGVNVDVLPCRAEHHFPIEGFVTAVDGIALIITPIPNNIAVRFIAISFLSY